MADDSGYVDYFEVLGLTPEAKPGEVRKTYRKKMRELVDEIRKTEITEDRRARFLLEMAKMNAGLIILRDNDERDAYWNERGALIELEERYRSMADQRSPEADALRRQFDSRLRAFLSKYLEETMLQAGHDKECVENSGWDAAHERHASRILRHYRYGLYRQILERLPYTEVTPPAIDWDERRQAVAALMAARSA